MKESVAELAHEPTRLAYLIGDPVAHSLSPSIHNAAFNVLGLRAEYKAIKVAPADLPDALASLKAHDVLGANVTIPHKQAVVSLVDDLGSHARAIGAANAIQVTGELELIGHNTDITGFLDPLQAHAESLREAPMVVLGAGGSARAVCYALLTSLSPRRLTVVARREEQADLLCNDLSKFDEHSALSTLSFNDAALAIEDSALIVNATPVGMTPSTENTPWSDSRAFRTGQLIYDLVYAPAETRLRREARAQGAKTIGGKAMLLSQAAASFKLWTGKVMPLTQVVEKLGDTF